ncbi:hypothetical protein MSG28_004166 [Choristoneura fumiferana]|uniref:Uncharacterized protein n=1 Tax=Choristoneura fumiferana TaxID=7141 RepID=A0ACC0KHR7_CHOFU|nr:hypothetical protein MSG28_004166 [Choristoneura fumiferana]
MTPVLVYKGFTVLMTVKPKLNMKTIALFVLVALAAAVSADGDYAPYDLRQAPALFSKFEKDYDREYKDAVDRKVHFEAFKKFLREVQGPPGLQLPSCFANPAMKQQCLHCCVSAWRLDISEFKVYQHIWAKMFHQKE